mgnify:CR=1 FL=1
MSKDIIGFLKEHEASSPVSFHMPGHKGVVFYDRNGFGKEVRVLASWDITEIAGADNLFQPESIIYDTMNKYKALYGSKKSYLLINGSSSGIIAALLAAVPRGGKLSQICVQCFVSRRYKTCIYIAASGRTVWNFRRS